MNVWEIFADHLGGGGYDENDLNALLKFIDALEPPIALPRVLDNFLQIIPCLQSLAKLYSGIDNGILPLSKWRDICLELRSAPAMQELLIATNKKGKMPLWSKYRTNPVYVAIWQRPGSVTDQQNYFWLLAHCLIAVALLRARTDRQILNEVLKQDLGDFKLHIKNALLAVRKLAIPANQITLKTLPDLNLPPEILLQSIDKNNDALSSVSVLLNDLIKYRKPAHRQKHATTNNVRSPRIKLPAKLSEIYSNLDPDQEEGVTTFELLQLPVVEATKAEEIEILGCSPTESCSGVEIVTPKISKTNHKQVKTPKQKVLKKRRIKTQLAMLNQRLTSRWEVLSPYEVSELLTAICDLSENKESSACLPVNATYSELAALLVTLFWFGQRLDKAILLKKYSHDIGNKWVDPGFVEFSEIKGYWWTKPAVPERKILPDCKQLQQAHHAVPNYAISSGIGFEQIICSHIRKARSGRSDLLFTKELSVYQKIVSDFFSSVNSHHSTRLTVNRVSDYLFNEIANQDGADLTSAMFIFGRENFLGRNPSYYTSISITQLQDLYSRVCRNVWNQHLNEKPSDNQKLINDDLAAPWIEINQTDHVGSPFRPTQSTVAKLVLELKNSLNNANRADTSVSKLLEVHEKMTQYTTYLVAFSTGFRAISDPFLSAAEIDWESGFAVLSDKDNEDSYNSRLIWLPPVCLQQLLLFREHQQNALYRFNILIPKIFTNPDRPRRDEPGRYMFFAKKNITTDKYEAKTLRPTHLGQGLDQIYDLPLNSSRHYLRSRLLEKKCPIEVINAFMGHFERGEEPWGVFSGLSPLVYRDSLKENLIELLRKDGWEPLSGLKAQL